MNSGKIKKMLSYDKIYLKKFWLKRKSFLRQRLTALLWSGFKVILSD